MQHAAQKGLGGSPGQAADAESLDGGGVAVPAPRRINRYLKPELVEEMVRLYQDGHTVKEIAKQFGFHQQTVARHLKRAGSEAAHRCNRRGIPPASSPNLRRRRNGQGYGEASQS